MSAVAKDQTPSIKSVTIIRQDVLPNACPGVQAAARQARFLQSVALLLTPLLTPDKAYADVTEAQQHTFEWDATENPIQNGSTITDHVRRLPDTFDAVCVFTDTPFFPPSPIQLNRAHREWTKLLSFAEAREPVFIATSLRIYPSMIIRRLSVARDATTGAVIRVAILAREIRVASSLLEVPLTDGDVAALGAAPITDGGTQTATQVA